VAEAVALDTNALIAAVEMPRDRALAARHLAARHHIDQRFARRQPLVLSSVALAEFVAGYPANAEDEAVEIARSLTTVVDFDVATARRYAQLRRSAKDLRLRAALYAGQPHECFAADLAILASAVEAGCTVIYSYDGGMRELAERCLGGVLDVREFPAA
jgi:predicted nucleic acid-binding protein